MDVHEHGELADRNPAAYSVIEAARQAHGKDMMAYCIFMAVRLLEMQRILKPTGSIYLHCDDTAGHYLKLLMDSVFGARKSAACPLKQYCMLFSAGGIGYLFVSTEKLDDWFALIFWLTAASLFAAAIFFAFMVLRKNADYIEAFIGNPKGCQTQKLDDTIGKHTRCATGFFVAGSAAAAAFVLRDPVLGLAGCS